MAASSSGMQFIHPGSNEAEEIRNILVKYKTADDLYPHKPARVIALVSERSGKRFTSHNHTQAWRKYAARPRRGDQQPHNTNKDHCIYHAAHGDYTYSEKWIDFLVAEIATAEGFAAICATRI